MAAMNALLARPSRTINFSSCGAGPMLTTAKITKPIFLCITWSNVSSRLTDEMILRYHDRAIRGCTIHHLPSPKRSRAESTLLKGYIRKVDQWAHACCAHRSGILAAKTRGWFALRFFYPFVSSARTELRALTPACREKENASWHCSEVFMNFYIALVALVYNIMLIMPFCLYLLYLLDVLLQQP